MNHAELVHAAQGRVRVRVPALSQASARALVDALGEHGLTAVRVNHHARSVVVCDPSGRPGEELAALVGERVSAAMAAPRNGAGAIGAPHSRSGRLALLAGIAATTLVRRLIGVTLPPGVIAIAIAIAARPIARRAWASVVEHRRLSIDVLDLAAIALTTLRGAYLTPAVMIASVEAGEAIRERTARASRRELDDLVAAMTPEVWIERDGGRVRVSNAEIGAGDVVVVYPGDRIPVDGRILDGAATVDEHKLTGESMPVVRGEGEAVYASTLVREGHVHIGVELIGEETRAGRMVRLMRDAPVHDTRVENHATRVSDRLVAPAFLLSGGLLALTRDPTRAASVLISDLTTGIRVSVPTTILAGLRRAARRGILVRSGSALELLAGVDAIVFDKTGTVTHGEPTITAVVPVDPGTTQEEILRLAASADQRLTHPVAEAVVRHAAQRGVHPARRTGWSYQLGLGVRAEVEGQTVLVGSDRLLGAHGIDLAGSRPDDAVSAIYVASDGVLRGTMTYADPVRPESAGVMAALRRQGMETHLLTGDRADVATAVARQLGIGPDDVHARLFPEQKAELVRALRARGRRVAFVGDGINDLPALVYADVAVSFGGASDAARETADVVLMDDDLARLPEAIDIARHAGAIVRQNITLVAGVNLGAIALAATGGLGPVAAAVVHNGTSVVAALNGLRPPTQPGPQQTTSEGDDDGGA